MVDVVVEEEEDVEEEEEVDVVEDVVEGVVEDEEVDVVEDEVVDEVVEEGEGGDGISTAKHWDMDGKPKQDRECAYYSIGRH